jgi:hypothetical protein
MVKQIKNTCGTWPPTHETLVNDYLQLFVTFIKSIDYRFAMTCKYKKQIDLRECM